MDQDQISIIRLSYNQIDTNILAGMRLVFSRSYFGTHMYEDFCMDLERAPDFFTVFLAYDDVTIVGIAVIEEMIHEQCEYFSFSPIHIKRFTVLPEYRSHGIGKLLLNEATHYVFEELKESVVFGESNEAGALSFYGREGALFALDIIRSYSKRNTPEDNVLYFKEFITNPVFKTYRYPVGNGIQFVLCTDEYKDFFMKHGYVSKSALLAESIDN